LLCIWCISAYDMCSAAHWLLYSTVRFNSDYQVHVMGYVPYVGWATCSRATVKIRLYVFIKNKKIKKNKKKKTGRHKMYMNKLLCFHAKKANYGMKEYPKQKRRKLWDCWIKDYKNIKPQSYHNIYIYIYIYI
jgi:hypothetical protein